MTILSIFNLRGLAVTAAIAILTTTITAFAAANTVPATKAGDGSGGIAGYTITDVTYVLLTGDPTKIDKVKFKITGSTPDNPATVHARIDEGAWSANCLPDAGVYTCDFVPDPDVTTATSLQVVAAQ